MKDRSQDECDSHCENLVQHENQNGREHYGRDNNGSDYKEETQHGKGCGDASSNRNLRGHKSYQYEGSQERKDPENDSNVHNIPKDRQFDSNFGRDCHQEYEPDVSNVPREHKDQDTDSHLLCEDKSGDSQEKPQLRCALDGHSECENKNADSNFGSNDHCYDSYKDHKPRQNDCDVIVGCRDQLHDSDCAEKDPFDSSLINKKLSQKDKSDVHGNVKDSYFGVKAKGDKKGLDTKFKADSDVNERPTHKNFDANLVSNNTVDDTKVEKHEGNPNFESTNKARDKIAENNNSEIAEKQQDDWTIKEDAILTPCNGLPPELEPEILSIPVAPDGGYGWIVCACAFLVMLILDGMLFTFGVLFLDLLEYFQESKSKTALVGSILMGTHLLVGPLTSALVNAWSIRTVALVGSCLAAGSFMLSTVAPSVDILIVTYGIMGGIGMSMVYIPTIFAVGFYFEKRRALANGIANSGSGVGTFVFAPLTSFLQDKYGWQGALLIISGLVLNCAVFVALFRPLELKRVRRLSFVINTLKRNSHDSFTVSHLNYDRESRGMNSRNGSIPKAITNPQILNIQQNSINHTKNQGVTNSSCTNLHIKHEAIARMIRSNTTDLHPKLFTGSATSIDDMKYTKYHNNKRYANLSMNDVNNLNYSILSLGQRRHLTNETLNKPLYRKDIFYSRSVMKLNDSTDNLENIGSYYHDLDEIEEVSHTPQSDEERKNDCKDNICKGLKLIAGLSILSKPVFLLAVVMSVLWTTHSAVLTILPNYATLSGVSSKDASILVSIIGIFNIIGRIFSGYLADRFDCIIINAIALFFGGLVNFMIPWTVNYYFLCVLSAIFGLGMGSWTSLRPIVLVHILGIDNLTNAFGVLAMFQGAAFCIGPPLAGLFYDSTQSYKLPFTVAGCAFLTSSFLCIPLHFMGRKRVPVIEDMVLQNIEEDEEEYEEVDLEEEEGTEEEI